MQNTSFRIRLCRNVWQRVALVLPLLLAGVCLFQACSNDDTSYADKRKRERRQVQNFLKKGAKVVDTESGLYLLDVPGNIKVISEEQFYKQDSTTNVAQNEYVLFAGSGVYMQILRKGQPGKIASGKSAPVVCRYLEYNLATDSLQSGNNVLANEDRPDEEPLRSCRSLGLVVSPAVYRFRPANDADGRNSQSAPDRTQHRRTSTLERRGSAVLL